MHRLIERSLWSLPREETEEKIDRRGDGEIGRDGSSLDSYSKDSYSSHFLADSTDSRVWGLEYESETRYKRVLSFLSNSSFFKKQKIPKCPKKIPPAAAKGYKINHMVFLSKKSWWEGFFGILIANWAYHGWFFFEEV